jgi:hypothetical protein
MAYLVIEINTASDGIGELNEKVLSSADQYFGIHKLENYLAAVVSGAKSATVQVAVRDSTQGISAAGGGNSVLYNKI